MAHAQSPGWRRQFRNQFRKTKLCYFNAIDQCKYGQKCAYAHSPSELESVPNLTKTALCLAWQKGQCPRAAADCHFAHGSEELRLTPAFNNTKFSQRTRTTQHDSDESQEVPFLDFEKLAEDVLSDSTQDSTRSGSMSRESTSTTVEDLVAMSSDSTGQGRSGSIPKRTEPKEEVPPMSRAGPNPLTTPQWFPAPPGLDLPSQSWGRQTLPAPPGLDLPSHSLGRPMLAAPPGLDLPDQSWGRPTLPAPPGLGPPMQHLGGRPMSCHPAMQQALIAAHLSMPAPQMASTLPPAFPATTQHWPLQDPYSFASVALNESPFCIEDSFRPK